MGDKPLTWQQVVAVLCVLGMLAAAVFAWGGDIPDAYRPRGAEHHLERDLTNLRD